MNSTGLYVYVDIISFYKPGTVRDIQRGCVSDFDITQGWRSVRSRCKRSRV
jgi:hypothetical protein